MRLPLGGEFAVLLYHVAGNKGCTDVERLYVLGNPCRLKVEQWLVACEFGVALRVGQHNHRECAGVFDLWLDRNLGVCRGVLRISAQGR